MDLQFATLLSLGESIIWARAHGGLQSAQLSPLSFLSRFLLYFVVQYGMVKFYRVVVYPHFLSPLRHLPGPKNNLPLIGQMGHVVSSASPMEPYLTWSAKWPREPFVRFLGIGNQETLMINTPEAHKEVLQTYCYSFRKPDILYRLVGDIIGRGLLFAEGAEHKRQRRIMLGLFSVPNMKKIFPVFQERARMMSQWFEEHLNPDGEAVFDVAECYSRMGLDIVGLTVLGVDLGHLGSSDPKWDFLSCFHRIFQPSKLSGIITFINVLVPGIRWFLPIEANLGYVRAVNKVHEMMLECVRQRIRDVDAAVEKNEKFQSVNLYGGGRDLLTLVVEERRRFKGTEDELTDVEMTNQMLTFLAAGHETTMGTLIWSSFVLATHPEAQEKLRREITEMLESTGASGVSWDKIERLHYLNNFIKEVLRLFCPPLNSYRESITNLNICGIHVPKGTLFYFNMGIANHSASTWGDTVEDFIPERWDDLRGDAASPYAFEAFSNGPRFCIGRNFALMEIKSVLVEMVSKFRFVRSPELEALGGRVPEFQAPSVTLTPKGGLKVGLEKI